MAAKRFWSAYIPAVKSEVSCDNFVLYFNKYCKSQWNASSFIMSDDHKQRLLGAVDCGDGFVASIEFDALLPQVKPVFKDSIPSKLPKLRRYKASRLQVRPGTWLRAQMWRRHRPRRHLRGDDSRLCLWAVGS